MTGMSSIKHSLSTRAATWSDCSGRDSIHFSEAFFLTLFGGVCVYVCMHACVCAHARVCVCACAYCVCAGVHMQLHTISETSEWMVISGRIC